LSVLGRVSRRFVWRGNVAIRRGHRYDQPAGWFDPSSTASVIFTPYSAASFRGMLPNPTGARQWPAGIARSAAGCPPALVPSVDAVRSGGGGRGGGGRGGPVVIHCLFEVVRRCPPPARLTANTIYSALYQSPWLSLPLELF